MPSSLSPSLQATPATAAPSLSPVEAELRLQLQEALCALQGATAALQVQSSENASLQATNATNQAEKKALRRELCKANATIVKQDDLLARYEDTIARQKCAPVQFSRDESDNTDDDQSSAEAQFEALTGAKMEPSDLARHIHQQGLLLPVLKPLIVNGAPFNATRPATCVSHLS